MLRRAALTHQGGREAVAHDGQQAAGAEQLLRNVIARVCRKERQHDLRGGRCKATNAVGRSGAGVMDAAGAVGLSGWVVRQAHAWVAVIASGMAAGLGSGTASRKESSLNDVSLFLQVLTSAVGSLHSGTRGATGPNHQFLSRCLRHDSEQSLKHSEAGPTV